MPKILPIEIRDAIIDEVVFQGSIDNNFRLPLEYRQCLWSLHAASKATRHRVLKYMFKKITISNNKKAQSRLKALRELMEPSTSLEGVQKYIKDLSFEFNAPPDQLVTSTTRSPAQELMEDENMIFILKALRERGDGPERVTLLVKAYFGRVPQTPTAIYGPQVEWTILTPEFRSAFQNLIHSSNLVSLHIQDVAHFPVHMIEAPNLKDLSLYQHREETVEYMDRSGSSLYPVLEKLHTNYLFVSSNQLKVAPSFFNHLKILTVQTRRGDGPVALLGILQKCGHIIETLDVHIFDNLEFDIQTLGEAPSLKSFTIAQWGPIHGVPIGDTRHVVSLLDVSDPMAYLEHISLSLCVADASGLLGPFIDITHPAWNRIDTILTSKMYPKLRRVDIDIQATLIYPYTDQFNPKKFILEHTPYFAQQFHQLAGSNLDFRFKLTCGGDVIVGNREE